uniref:Immunoglobulin V-set domain-containing protein n=1 Tax=Anas zonorhyncha TaxID=75864 RepID=A0A8B9UFA5_9AVES
MQRGYLILTAFLGQLLGKSLVSLTTFMWGTNLESQGNVSAAPHFSFSYRRRQILISYQAGRGTKQRDRFTTELNPEEKSSVLHLKEVKLSDSALYLCAVSDTLLYVYSRHRSSMGPSAFPLKHCFTCSLHNLPARSSFPDRLVYVAVQRWLTLAGRHGLHGLFLPSRAAGIGQSLLGNRTPLGDCSHLCLRERTINHSKQSEQEINEDL